MVLLLPGKSQHGTTVNPSGTRWINGFNFTKIKILSAARKPGCDMRYPVSARISCSLILLKLKNLSSPVDLDTAMLEPVLIVVRLKEILPASPHDRI